MKGTNKRMVIKDTYGYKHYEIIELDNGIYVFDYTLRRFLKDEEKKLVIKFLNKNLSDGGAMKISVVSKPHTGCTGI